MFLVEMRPNFATENATGRDPVTTPREGQGDSNPETMRFETMTTQHQVKAAPRQGRGGVKATNNDKRQQQTTSY